MGNGCPLCRTPIDIVLRVFFSDCNVFNVLAETVSELCVLADFIYLFIYLFYFILFYLSIHSLKE